MHLTLIELGVTQPQKNYDYDFHYTNNIFIGNKKQQYFYKNNLLSFWCDIFPALQSLNKEFILFVI